MKVIITDVLKLKILKEFNIYNKKAIKDALKNPRKIDQKMVDKNKNDIR